MSIWGRIIGGTAGFALGGPLGGILGVIAGSVFDKRRRSSFNFSNITQDQKQQIFTLGIITLSAKLAKSDGKVTSDEINAFKEKFRIPKNEIPKISKIFNEAKKNVYGYGEGHLSVSKFLFGRGIQMSTHLSCVCLNKMDKRI